MSDKADNVKDNDDLEAASEVRAVPAVTGQRTHAVVAHQQSGESEQYHMHEEHVPILPGQILTDTIARLRFIIVIVSFFYSGLIFITAILAICLIAPNLLYWLDNNSPILINTARIIISLVALGMSLACIAVIFKQQDLTEKLAVAEVMIDQIRDLALIQMQATRYNMEDLAERLKFPKEHDGHGPSPFDYIDLARRLGPVLQLLLAKERSVMTIAVEGVKLFSALKKVLHK